MWCLGFAALVLVTAWMRARAIKLPAFERRRFTALSHISLTAITFAFFSGGYIYARVMCEYVAYTHTLRTYKNVMAGIYLCVSVCVCVCLCVSVCVCVCVSVCVLLSIGKR